MGQDTIAHELRAVLRAMARSVVVVTARSGQASYAMTATAVCEVSMDPPSILLCVNRDATMFPVLDDGADLTLNVLGHPHGEVSHACGGARRGEDRFAVGDWDMAEGPNPPSLRDAAAIIRLRQARHLERLPTSLHRRHRPAGARCAAGRFRPGAALLVGHDAEASLPPRASPRTEITSVPAIQPDRKPL